MENIREGWDNRGSDGSRGGRGSRALSERHLPPHDTALKRRRTRRPNLLGVTTRPRAEKVRMNLYRSTNRPEIRSDPRQRATP